MIYMKNKITHIKNEITQHLSVGSSGVLVTTDPDMSTSFKKNFFCFPFFFLLRFNVASLAWLLATQQRG